MAISTASCEARHRYCEPKPKRPPDSSGSARFSAADMLVLPLLGRPGTGGEGSSILIASSLPANAAEERRTKFAEKPMPNRPTMANCQKLLQILRN
jgi:hypothetical protein